MSKMIHKTAIVENCSLGKDVTIGPYSVVLDSDLADGVTIGSHCSIGNYPQHKSHPVSKGRVWIGKNAILRNYVTVDLPTITPTSIGEDCYLMHYSHVSHDTVLEKNVTLCNSVQIGGHTTIMQGCTLGLGSLVEQRSFIGPYSFFGMGSKLRGNLQPFCKYVEQRRIGANVVGLKRRGLTEEQISTLINWWNADIKDPCDDNPTLFLLKVLALEYRRVTK